MADTLRKEALHALTRIITNNERAFAGDAPHPTLLSERMQDYDLVRAALAAPAVEPRSSGEREAEYRRLRSAYREAVYAKGVAAARGTVTAEVFDCMDSAHAALDAFVLPLLREPDAPTLGLEAAAMKLAVACYKSVERGVIDARSEIGDALLDWAHIHSGSHTDPFSTVRATLSWEKP